MFAANYKSHHWKCIAVLKGDGTQAITEGVITPAAPVISTISPQSTAKYYKLGTISHPNQVPWH